MSVSSAGQREELGAVVHDIATLKYSVWRTGKKFTVRFFHDGASLKAVLSRLDLGSEYQTIVEESHIFHAGWFRSDCVENRLCCIIHFECEAALTAA
jgi:hypothetical protein